MTQSEFEQLADVKCNNFDTINWAYNRSGMSNVAFGQSIEDIVEHDNACFATLENLLMGIKEAVEDEMNDLRIQLGKAEKRANALGELAYKWSQNDEEHINEVAELYGKDAYCVRTIEEGGTLTPELKQYVTDIILNG